MKAGHHLNQVEILTRGWTFCNLASLHSTYQGSVRRPTTSHEKVYDKIPQKGLLSNVKWLVSKELLVLAFHFLHRQNTKQNRKCNCKWKCYQEKVISWVFRVRARSLIAQKEFKISAVRLRNTSTETTFNCNNLFLKTFLLESS